MVGAAGGVPEDDAARDAIAQSRVGWLRLLVVGGFIAAIELLCRLGAISPRVLLAPSDIALRLIKLLASGNANADIVETFGNVALSLVLSVAVASPSRRGDPTPFLACARPSIRSRQLLRAAVFRLLSPVHRAVRARARHNRGDRFPVRCGRHDHRHPQRFDRIPRVLLRTAAVHHMGPPRPPCASSCRARCRIWSPGSSLRSPIVSSA